MVALLDLGLPPPSAAATPPRVLVCGDADFAYTSALRTALPSARILATAFEPVETAHDGPEEAHMTIERWPLDDAIAAASDGRITDSKTQIGILAAARRLGR